MREKWRLVLASLAVLLGIAHCAYGAIVFGGHGLEMVWFLGAGIAMIVAGLSNLSGHSKTWVLMIQNLITLAYVILIAVYAPEPQVFVGLVLFAGLFILSVLPKTKAYA